MSTGKKCDFCEKVDPPVIFDFKTKYGPWAWGCADCYTKHRLFPNLGVGKGQKYEIFLENGKKFYKKIKE
jgi:hypothetical protein